MGIKILKTNWIIEYICAHGRQNIYNMDFVKTVYDPFGGSGTTLAAAEKTGHTAYLMELTPGYTDVIVKRYFRITGNKDQIQLIRDGAPADPAVYAEIFDDVGISSEYKEGEYE